jgi:hypothetical protein
VVAPAEQPLAELVKDELRGPVSELVRQVVVELVREQLNGDLQAAAEKAVSSPGERPTGDERPRPDPPTTPRRLQPENVRGLRGDEAWLGVPAGSSRMPAKLDASLTRTGESLYSSGSRNEHLPRDEVTNGLVSLCSRA